MSLTALLDGDIVAYRCAAASEGELEEVAILRTDQMMMDILHNTDNYITFLSGKNNFRYEIYPDYKANRKDKPRPKWLSSCKDYLVKEYNAIVTDGYEADDALGMAQKEGTVIYSIDKDLLMIPGCHYNFIKKVYTEVSELEALKTFYKQMLIGDVSDNVKGVVGIGPVKAAKLLDHLETEEEMYKVVYELYKQPDYSGFNEFFWQNADCLWIWRQLGETFSKRKERMERRETEELYNERPSRRKQTVAS